MQHIIGCYLFQLATTKCGSFPWPPKCSSLIHCRSVHLPPLYPTVPLSICPPLSNCLSVPLSPLIDRHRASRSLARLFHLTENAMIFHVHFTHFEFEIFLNARFHSKSKEHWVFFFRFSFWFWHFKSVRTVRCPSVCRIRPVLPFEVLNFSCAFN